MPPFFFIIILAAVIFLVALIRTDIALILLIFSMFLSPELPLGRITGRAIVVRIDDILLFVVFFGWLAKRAINKEMGFLRTTPLNRPILAYLFICILSSFLGILRGNIVATESAFYIIKYFEYFLIFFMVSNNIKDMKQAKIFTYFLLFVCFLMVVYAWYQHLRGVHRVTAPFEGVGGEPNTLGGYFLLMIGVIGGLLLHTHFDKRRLILFGFLLLAIPTFVFTLSRASWIGFIPAYLSLIIISKKGKGILIPLLIITIMFAPVIFPRYVHQRVQDTFVPGMREETHTIFGKTITFDDSTATRIGVWRRGLEEWSRKPILGWGVPGFGDVVDVQYARVLAETGSIGFLAFVWLLVMVYRAAYRTYRVSENNTFAKGLALGFLVGFIGLLTQALGTETFIIIRIMEPFWFLTAIVVMLPEISPSPETTDTQ